MFLNESSPEDKRLIPDYVINHGIVSGTEIQGLLRETKVGDNAGTDPRCLFRGAQKIMCPHAHYERKTEHTFGRGPLKGPGSSRVVLMLSRAI